MSFINPSQPIKNINPLIIPIRVINGIKYVHYSYCSFRHDKSIKVNGDTYYQVND